MRLKGHKDMLKQLHEMYGKNEPLCDELKGHLETCDIFGEVLKHPLVFMVPYFAEHMGGLANRALKQKKEQMARAIANGELMTVVWLHERPYRIDALRDYVAMPSVPEADFAKALLQAWTDCENVWQNYDWWVELLSMRKIDWMSYADKVDSEAFDALPAVVDIYRGGITSWEDTPLSWTTDREKAEWFARRFGKVEDANLMKATIEKKHIYFYTNGRSESEVVVDPEHVKVNWYEPIVQ
jgi:hypothetical protein